MTDDEDDLFKWGEAYARRTDPWTSHKAAEEMDAAAAERLAWLTIFYRGPLTTVQIGEINNMPRDYFSPRMRPLCRKGLAYEHGVDRTSKRPRIIWGIITKTDLSPELRAPVYPIPGSIRDGAAADLTAATEEKMP